MRCPKCQFDHELQTTECLKCGIVFARYQAALEAASKRPALIGPVRPVSAPKLTAVTEPAQNRDARQELIYRALALPLGLLGARFVVGTGLRMAVGMVTMVLHESGHAVTCWLTGRWAVPMLWVTLHGDERSGVMVLAVTAAIGFGGFRAWVARRWAWVLAAGVVLILQLLCLTVWRFYANSLIIFFGEGGALVLATILMAMFYADRESALYKSWGLRWGLLAIGAAVFMDVYRTWSGPLEDLPFGEIEGVNLSDPTLLTETYGWPVLLMVDRYLRLARFCLMALAVLYIWGLISTYLEMRSQASPAGTGTAR
jgi:hypothetical protein